MGARLLLAFLAITAFAVLSAAAGLYAFREVGGRLEVVQSRVPPSVSALELSRTAERIIAAAPALLAATDRTRRNDIKAELAAEAAHLKETLGQLKHAGPEGLPVATIEPVIASLSDSLGDLEALVARRLETAERIAALRRDVFLTSTEVHRLLKPWREVVASEIAILVRASANIAADRGSDQGRLQSLIQLQQVMDTAQRQLSAVMDMLTEASTAERPSRLPIIEFQLRLALRDVEATAAGLDPKLRPLLLEQVERLRDLAVGPDAMPRARMQELELVRQGEALLAESGQLSAQLTAAVDQLGRAAKQDIADAIRDARWVQDVSARALLGLVALSLITSVLIVWLYIGGNIVRRLNALSHATLAIAGGRLRMPMAVDGNDEIAAMSRAVEIFRRNAIELERLLEERKETASRLERLVAERTRELSDKSHQLEIANKHKSHFLASASHDLRQPLHALNMFVAQLPNEADAAERNRLVQRIDAAVSSMNELFELLLDMSRLEAGILEPHPEAFPVERAFKRIETTFAEAARQKGLRLSLVSSRAWVRSDPVLLERILTNLVANALHYTARGGVVIGCRRRAGCLRIDVCDTGPGIAPEQQQKIFGEYYRVPSGGPQRSGSFGLGLAIVDRLARLLNHEVELASRPGRGSRFSVSLPLAQVHDGIAQAPAPAVADPAAGKLVVVIDDDPLVLEGMGGILRSWGCGVVTADGGQTALSAIAAHGRRPDLIISDYRLADATTGIQVIQRLRSEYGAVPAFLISGDTAPERLRDAHEHGIHLVHKPVSPMRLRAMFNQLLNSPQAADVTAPAAE